MTTNYGAKVSKAGYNITTTDPRELLMSSGYTMLKQHSDSGSTIEINAGNQEGSVDFNHSLGYVPAFAAYIYGSNAEIQQLNNAMRLIPLSGGYKEGFPWVHAYATSSKITIDVKLPAPYNQTTTVYNSTDTYNENGMLTDGDITQWFIAGTGSAGGDDGSAIRWNNIALTQGQTITSATFKYTNLFTTAGCDIKFKVYGIDEDDTADFGGNPMGRTKTTEYTDKTQSANTNKFNFSDDWTDICQEIVDRGGWSTGNAMGFIFNNNGTVDNSHWLQVDVGDRISENMELTIVTTGSGSITFNVRVIIFKDKIV